MTLIVSAQDASCRSAGVFEYDGKVAHFYLLDQWMDEGKKIVKALPLFPGAAVVAEGEVRVAWNDVESEVRLFIRGEECAVIGVLRSLSS